MVCQDIYISESPTSQGLELVASNDKGQRVRMHYIGYSKKEAYRNICQELKGAC